MGKILVLGATGMLGSYFFKNLSSDPNYEVISTSRWSKEALLKFFTHDQVLKIELGVNIDHKELLEKLIQKHKPDWVVNCIGLIKQQKEANKPSLAIQINALFPHILAEICNKANTRLLHISTDCVFNGRKGMYTESDISNAEDIYGRTKFLGEVTYGDHITLRTSIIGHELNSAFGLIDWFLSQNGQVNGYSKAIYSGFTVNELTDFIKKHILSSSGITGLVQLSSNPINKFDLLQLVKKVYEKDINIVNYSDFKIDRSLDSSFLRSIVNYYPPTWEEMIVKMHQEFQANLL